MYQSTFAPSRDWSSHYAEGPEIKAYWADVANKYDAQKYIRCNHEVQSATWDGQKAKWLVTVKHGIETTVEEADFFIVATGRFSHPTMPIYPGMSEYKGHLVHSSRWDSKFDPAGKNIAIIGNGSSGLQILPRLQKTANRIDHYARSPTWVAGSFGGNAGDSEKLISDDLRSSFQDPEAYLNYRKGLEHKSFTGFDSIMKDGAKSKKARAQFTEDMKARLGDRPDLLNTIKPDFSPSCRRLTPGPNYLEALTQPNVDYMTTAIERFTETGIRTVDGNEKHVDAIICCTGSEKSFAPPFPIISGDVDLSSAWKPGGQLGFPNTYLGFAVPGFPNFLFINGPNTAAATGTLPYATENQVTYIAKLLRKVRTQGIRTVVPTLQATEDFRAYCEEYFPRTVMSENCSSWFNGGIKGGRVLANWPGSGLHANLVRREPRWEDWEYTYRSGSGNRFAYFGNGWTVRDVEVSKDIAEDSQKAQFDLASYLQLDSVTGQLDLKDYHEAWHNA